MAGEGCARPGCPCRPGFENAAASGADGTARARGTQPASSPATKNGSLWWRRQMPIGRPLAAQAVPAPGAGACAAATHACRQRTWNAPDASGQLLVLGVRGTTPESAPARCAEAWHGRRSPLVTQAPEGACAHAASPTTRHFLPLSPPPCGPETYRTGNRSSDATYGSGTLLAEFSL